MHTRAGIWRTMIATLLCAFLTAVTVSPAALAQGRGNSGLPSGPGNPIAKLQREINALTQQIAALARLGQDVITLGQQVAALQQQMTTLARLGQDVSTLGQQVAALQQQMTALAGLQPQIDVLNSQVASLNTHMADVSSQLAALSGSDPLGVYDANEKKIGDVVGVQDNIPWVSVAAAGHVFALQVLPGQLIGAFLWYTGQNCSGTPYISGTALSNGPNVFSVAAVKEPGGVIYASDADAALQRVNVRSVLQHDGTCFTFSASFGQSAVPATPVMTLDAAFKRPYSVH